MGLIRGRERFTGEERCREVHKEQREVHRRKIFQKGVIRNRESSQGKKRSERDLLEAERRS